MPIKDKEKAKQYFKEYMAKRRQGLTVKLESVLNQNVKPEPNLLNPEFVKPVKPIAKNVKPKLEVLNPVKPIENNFVKPCSLAHYSFKELFKQVTEQVRKDFQTIYSQYPETARKCFDCHNRERNYQIMFNLLNSYERKCKAQ
jgi:hypothetical protein